MAVRSLRDSTLVVMGALAAAAAAGLAAPWVAEGATGVRVQLILLTALCVAPIAASFLSTRGDVFSPLLLMSLVFLSLYALRGWVLAGDYSTFRSLLTLRVSQTLDTHLEPALNLAILAVAGFYAGYLWGVGPALVKAIPSSRNLLPELSARGLYSAGAVLLVVGVPFFAIVALQYQGLFLLGGQTKAIAGELLFNLAALPLAGIVLLGIGALRSRGRAGTVRKALLTVTLLVLLALAFISAQKALILWVLIAAGATYHYGHRRLRPSQAVAGFVVFAVFLFPAVQIVRHIQEQPDNPRILTALARFPDTLASERASDGRPRTEPLTPAGYVGDAFTTVVRRLYGFDALIVSRALTPSTYPYLKGETYERLPASFIPRALWRDKPELSLSGWFGDKYWGRPTVTDRSAQTTTFPGEMYLNFGWAGVGLGMFLLGVMYRAWYAYLAASWTPANIALYVMSLPALLLIESDLVLQLRTGVNRVLVTAAALVVVATLIKRSTGRGSTPPPTPA